MKFTSTDTYIAADDLAVAVNAAVTLERPLLVKGEPGTGKTELARQVASALGGRPRPQSPTAAPAHRGLKIPISVPILM